MGGGVVMKIVGNVEYIGDVVVGGKLFMKY